jgi:hypothetical protein
VGFQKTVDLARRQAGRHRHAQPLAAGVDPQRQAPGARVLDDLERQGASRDIVHTLDRGGAFGAGGRLFQSGEHGATLSDSPAERENIVTA